MSKYTCLKKHSRYDKDRYISSYNGINRKKQGRGINIRQLELSRVYFEVYHICYLGK